MTERPYEADDDYRYEHEAPPYTIIDRQLMAGIVRTTVVLEGEIAVFEASAPMRQLGAAAVRPLAERFNEIIRGLERE